MPRRRRVPSRRTPAKNRKNIRARVRDFFGWPWFGGKKSGRGINWLRLIVLATLWGGIALAISVVLLSFGLPDLKEAVDMDHRPTIVLRDDSGVEFARLGDIQGEPLKLSQMSPHLANAVMAIEDRRFYKHFGVDPIGLLRAMYTNIRSGGLVQGGSTITQQLAKNLFLSSDRTLIRKVKEALLALYLERRYSKDEILAAYLNRAYFGAGAYGADTAARVYFNSSARKLTLEQAAMLAGLLKAPSRYSPDNDPKLTTQRTRTVLKAMVDAGYLRPGAEKMTLQPLPAREYAAGGNLNARYFADWLAPQIEAYIGAPTENLIVDTTLHRPIQNHAATVIANTLDKDGAKLKASQGAAIVLRPNDGAVLAMVGGKDYGQSNYNRATVAERQPGSSFKLFVYLTALEAGYTPVTAVTDAPLRVGKYAPTNFDGKYRGTIQLQEAIALSLNTVAVRIAQDVGVSRIMQMARRLGITDDLTPDLSLALGSSDVRLLPLTAAYATLSNGGAAVEPYGISMIRDTKGKILYQRQRHATTQLLRGDVVANMNTLLQGVVQYGTGQAAMIDRPSAGKTGTSSDHRDAWFMGYTADLAAGVWVGNDDNSPMQRVTGGMLPARIWHDIMLSANQGYSIRALPSGAYAPTATPGPNGAAPQPDQGGLFDSLLRSILGDDSKPEPVIHWDN